ncbi:hypothetical protein [Paracraurococcus lichenis]|uniref:Argininosuccinate lyase n=1 Tax=Paracraurococcus lichenis TaxID=3064888 RepID=A0ABT9E7J3_9PROT|nr:hypothetical protein [Paracraurococcus sp. LOR1-02]MDO9712109.1 hypothetical protein [Paracraurococcus sp. LOR1-02]
MRAAYGLLAAAVISGMTLTGASAGQQDFVLANRTGYQIEEVYVSKTSTSSWENDVLGDDVLNHGKSVKIRFASGTRGCMYDLKVVYADGDKAEWGRINLCEVSKVTIFYNRRTGETRAETE